MIQSLTNEKVKHLVHLQNKAYRYQHQQFIAQGIKTCKTLMQFQYKLHSVYLSQAADEQYLHEFPQDLVTIVSDQIRDKIATTITPCGVVAIFHMPQSEIFISPESTVIYNMQDPGNLGTLIRTAAAMNFKALYLINCVDPFNPKVIQSTVGTIAQISIFQTTWEIFTTLLKDAPKSIQTCALIVSNGQHPDQVKNISDCILILGNESHGLPTDIIDQCNLKMTLPMPGNTESLNAAIAGSIAMYLKSQKL